MRRGRKRQCDTPHGRREGAQGGEGAKEDTNEDQYRRTRRETIARTIREPSFGFSVDACVQHCALSGVLDVMVDASPDAA